MRASRPRLRRQRAAWLFAVASVVLLVANGLWRVAALLVGLVAIIYGGAWLISPWSRFASNMILPDRETFEARVARSRRVADSIGRVPIIGAPWRLAQRATRGAVDQALNEQRRIIDEETRRRDT
jgi:hypothetical protein